METVVKSVVKRDGFLDELKSILDLKDILIDEPMSLHTSFKIGGPADIYLRPDNIENLKLVLKTCEQFNVPVYILGNGSNLLVTDKGIRGVVIEVFKKFDSCWIDGNKIKAGAGVLLASLASQAAKSQLTGLEFASGIPGTLGGAVFMNAGAYGGEMKQVVETVTVVTRDGKIQRLEKEALDFGYRHSAIQTMDSIVVEAELKLELGQYEDIKARMLDLNGRRKEKQPLEMASAGSTFKRPEGYYAGKLIMDAGLRGYSIGDAQVSEKHCGFVVNKGNASFEDVYNLIQYIKSTVFEQFGVELKREVKILGER